jgi:para-aminobenzoate synthetase component I
MAWGDGLVGSAAGRPPGRATYHRPVTLSLARPARQAGPRLRTVHGALVGLEPLPLLAGVAPMDAAEAFRDLPGVALLESARPGRNARWTYLTADPLAVADALPDREDPFIEARGLLRRMDVAPPTADSPPFLGGLVGFIGYEVGVRLLGLGRSMDGPLPPLRLALHDWVVAWDRRDGTAWLGGRAVDGDRRRLRARLDGVRERLDELLFGRLPALAAADVPSLAFRSVTPRDRWLSDVEAVRRAIADGEIYQANLTRRLEAPFEGDPWSVYRRVRTGDPAVFAGYLDLGGRRAIVSASPEPFVAIDGAGTISTDPIKGTRPRGRTREDDRRLACELLGSAKDRAENVMIVDVLRNDLGRVSVPGSVRVPRLTRLERTAAVQHLVSTVTGRLRPGLDPLDVLSAVLPGGSITGAPKRRAADLLAAWEPTRRGPYTGALGWIGPDGAMATSILIRTFVADGRTLALHVGGGITWRSDPAEEWAETVAKAAGPLGAIGAREVA